MTVTLKNNVYVRPVNTCLMFYIVHIFGANTMDEKYNTNLQLVPRPEH